MLVDVAIMTDSDLHTLLALSHSFTNLSCTSKHHDDRHEDVRSGEPDDNQAFAFVTVLLILYVAYYLVAVKVSHNDVNTRKPLNE